MFPKINRQIAGMAAMVHGLPPEVQELVCLIYGKSKHAECVRCQYETEAGLGAPFKNWMGAMMGLSQAANSVSRREVRPCSPALRTAATGGHATKVKDPGLFTAGGTRLPFMPYHAAYKYLGKYTRADAIDDVAWAKLLPKFEAGLSWLRSLHKVLLKDF